MINDDDGIRLNVLINRDLVLSLIADYERGKIDLHDLKFTIKTVPAMTCPCKSKTIVNQYGTSSATILGKVENLTL